MVRDLQEVEPEQRHVRKDAPLVGNAGRQHPVEGADAVRGNDDEPVAEIVNIAHLAATARDAGNVTLQERRRHTALACWLVRRGAFYRVFRKRGRVARRPMLSRCTSSAWPSFRRSIFGFINKPK